jgi:hypothetical protein
MRRSRALPGAVEMITQTGIRRRGMTCGESNEAAAELGTGTDPGKAGSRGSGARAPGGDAPQWRRTPRLRARMISSSHGRPGFPERKTRRHEGEDRGGGQGSVREGGPTVCRQSWCLASAARKRYIGGETRDGDASAPGTPRCSWPRPPSEVSCVRLGPSSRTACVSALMG